MTYEYETKIPDDIMRKYVITDQIIALNYFNYYKVFAKSGIIDLHEGSVSWIIPCKEEKGPSLAFRIHLNEDMEQNGFQNYAAEWNQNAVWLYLKNGFLITKKKEFDKFRRIDMVCLSDKYSTSRFVSWQFCRYINKFFVQSRNSPWEQQVEC